MIPRCAYCLDRPAIHFDHIVSKADRRRYEGDWENERVPACGPCNWRKLTRHLVPRGFSRLAELQAIDSTWREWSGDPSEDAFRKAHTA